MAEMEVFVAVIDNGGFTGAANKLRLSKSSVSKHVTNLESRLGVTLLNRTTRNVSATEIGISYYKKGVIQFIKWLDPKSEEADTRKVPCASDCIAETDKSASRICSINLTHFL